jgi:hypothetical protein
MSDSKKRVRDDATSTPEKKAKAASTPVPAVVSRPFDGSAGASKLSISPVTLAKLMKIFALASNAGTAEEGEHARKAPAVTLQKYAVNRTAFFKIAHDARAPMEAATINEACTLAYLNMHAYVCINFNVCMHLCMHQC